MAYKLSQTSTYIFQSKFDCPAGIAGWLHKCRKETPLVQNWVGARILTNLDDPLPVLISIPILKNRPDVIITCVVELCRDWDFRAY